MLICPACGGTNLYCLGKLPTTNGAFILSNPGYLYQCRSCEILFREPYIKEDELEIIYKKLDSDNWKERDYRPDYNLSAQIIREYFKSGNILDIGCFRGDFLAKLPDIYCKYGLEPSEAARSIAEDRGINLVGSYVDQIENNGLKFDCITLLDVIEHLPNPYKALSSINQLLKPNGIIIISTGNTNSFLWRILQKDYWYYLPEHVIFLNPSWFRWISSKLNVKILKVIRFSRFKGPLSEKYLQFISAISYRIYIEINKTNLLKQILNNIFPFTRIKQWSSSPTTNLWKDHMLIVLKNMPDR